MQSANSPASAAQQSKDTSHVIAALGSSNSPHPQLLDVIYTDADGVFRGYYSGKTVADFARAYEGEGRVQMIRICEFDKLHDDALRTAPEEITESDWDEAFSVRPPMKWQRLHGVESFRLTEFFSGTITAIYAKCDGRYWRFMDDAFMDIDALVDIVRAAPTHLLEGALR